MPLKIKQLPQSERPYEKLLMYGAKKLSNAELLAIIIKTGTKDETSIDIANRVLLLTDNISELSSISTETLEKIKGIGKVKAIQIKAICELATRINTPINNLKIIIKTPKDVANLFMQEFRCEKQEKLKILLLSSKNEIVKNIEIKTGSINEIQVRPAEILKEVIKEEVNKFILIHNHPSGDSTPSKADFDFTEKIEKGANLLNLNFLDHIVIGRDNYKSIKSLINKDKTLN